MIAKIERASDYSAWEDEEKEERKMEINSIADLEKLYSEARESSDKFNFHGLIVNFYDGEMHITIYDDFME